MYSLCNLRGDDIGIGKPLGKEEPPSELEESESELEGARKFSSNLGASSLAGWLASSC